MNERGHYGNAWTGQNQLPVMPPGPPPRPHKWVFPSPAIYLPVLGGAALGALLADKRRVTGGLVGGAAGGALAFLYGITHLAG